MLKQSKLKRILNLRSLAFAGTLFLAVFALSCNSNDEEYHPENQLIKETELKSGKAVKKADASIAEVAINNGNFNELVKALTYVDNELETGLVDLFLNGTEQYTVFAPTDAAFQNLYGILGVGDITEVDAPTVLNVLLYHVTEGRRAANSVVPPVNPRVIETLLEGATFSVDNSGKIWAVGNSAMIVMPNVPASNGIIHVIDAVILPITL